MLFGAATASMFLEYPFQAAKMKKDWTKVETMGKISHLYFWKL